MAEKRDNPEMRLHMAILPVLQAVLPREAANTLIHVPNGEKRSALTGALLKRMGTRRGVEDLQFIWKGRLHAIEVKPKGEYQSIHQRDRERAVLVAGGAYAVSRSTDDVRETLALWGIPSREVARRPAEAVA